MAEYTLTRLVMDGERILYDDARLKTQEGLDPQMWWVTIDGAHILATQPNRRVRLEMVTSEGVTAEGEANVSASGHHDEGNKMYYGVELQGIGKLTHD